MGGFIKPMTHGFWEKLKKPIYALAPMYDVTDASFRYMFAKYGKPSVFYTEFVSADGLASIGRQRLAHHLLFSPIEKPIIAQIFGAHPEKFTETADYIATLGFDGIDINMGCPDKNMMKQGSCAALYKNIPLARSVIRAAKAGAPHLPVSVKIRLGDTTIDWKNWIFELLQEQPAAIAVHLRTRKEMSKVPAHWEIMKDIVQFIQDETTPDTRPLILGNGDIKNLSDADQKIAETGINGVLVGRGAFGNPWFFDPSRTFEQIPLVEKLNALVEHTTLFEQTLGTEKSFELMKKHFKAYLAGVDNVTELKEQLYQTKNADDVTKVVKTFMQKL